MSMTEQGHAARAAEVTKPRLVFFYDPRDGRSRRTEAFLAQVLQHRHNHDTFVLTSVDVVARPDLAERFRVTSSPTVLVISDRAVRARLEQPKGVHQLEEALRPWLR
jgi:thioredoxin-like negative regulator of GroEL